MQTLISGCGKKRQVDCGEFETSLAYSPDYTVRPYRKKQQNINKNKQKTHLKVFFLKTIYGATESDESSKLKW